MEVQAGRLEVPPLGSAVAKVPRSEMVLGAGRASSKPQAKAGKPGLQTCNIVYMFSSQVTLRFKFALDFLTAIRKSESGSRRHCLPRSDAGPEKQRAWLKARLVLGRDNSTTKRVRAASGIASHL